jgi:hypothetical protein
MTEVYDKFLRWVNDKVWRVATKEMDGISQESAIGTTPLAAVVRNAISRSKHAIAG